MAISMRSGLIIVVAILALAVLAVLSWRAGGDQPVRAVVQPVKVPELPR